jgi:hypothetical protein
MSNIPSWSVCEITWRSAHLRQQRSPREQARHSNQNPWFLMQKRAPYRLNVAMPATVLVHIEASSAHDGLERFRMSESTRCVGSHPGRPRSEIWSGCDSRLQLCCLSWKRNSRWWEVATAGIKVVVPKPRFNGSAREVRCVRAARHSDAQWDVGSYRILRQRRERVGGEQIY